MCYPENQVQNPTAENASKDVFDLIIFGPKRAEIEIAFQIANANLNNAFLQVSLDAIAIQEHEYIEQPLEFVENAYGIRNAPITYIEAINNFDEVNIENLSEDFIEECEIQAILRGEY